uniref:Selenocysteine insertion sequence-binding protein 2-like n=1 Tax=Sinocyclocheilus grahami TaxID=75366 RepID=A0A672Q6Y2_SINGR
NPTGSSAQSWANIASQPPRVIQKSSKANRLSQVNCCTVDQHFEHVLYKIDTIYAFYLYFYCIQEDLTTQLVEQTEKKRRKKKKKSKTASENAEETLEEHLIQQEPPKFEVKYVKSVILYFLKLDFRSFVFKLLFTSQKKSKVPVQLDLGNMLTVLEQKQQSQKSTQDQRPLTLSVGGALPVVHKEPSVQKKPWQQEKTPHNPLDSTCPLVKKGKQREVPKAKKPTPLKRVILREREERKQNRLLEERDPTRVATEAGENETSTSENPSETSLADHDQHLHTSMKHCNILQHFYCNQVLRKDVDECVSSLLKELVRFQDRLFQKDPMKARMKRRLVMGLREVLKHLKLRKVKCVIISPNCERIQSKGGLDEALHTIIDTCRDQGIPFVFALSRKALGRCVNKAVPVSLVGIFNYDGAQDHYHKMIELSAEARKAYEVMIANLETASPEEQEEQQEAEPSREPSGTEEPEYIKIWKKMLEKDYNHPFLNFEDQFSSISIGSEQLLDDHEGS